LFIPILLDFSAWVEEDDRPMDDESKEDEDEISESNPSLLRPSSSFGFGQKEDDGASTGKSLKAMRKMMACYLQNGSIRGTCQPSVNQAKHHRKQTLYIVMEFVL